MGLDVAEQIACQARSAGMLQEAATESAEAMRAALTNFFQTVFPRPSSAPTKRASKDTRKPSKETPLRHGERSR